MIFRLSAIILLFVPSLVMAQAPLGFNYQGIAREADGTPMSNSEIGIRVSIIDGPQGTVQFEEDHFLTTNDFGLFTAIIGQGNGGSTLNSVDWAGGNLWLQIELDPDNSGIYLLMGSQQLMSVPYALFAQESGAGLAAGSGISINNGKINNIAPDRPITLIEGTNVTIDNNYPNFTISATGNDADADPENEIQDLQLLGNNLTITNNGTATDIDLLPYLDNTDTQLTEAEVDAFASNNGYLTTEVDGSISNELQTISKSGATVSLSNGGGSFTDSVDDSDNDALNEIQDLQLATNTLIITNNTSPTSIDLSGYLDNTDSQNLSSSISGTNRTLNISGGTSTTFSVADNDNLPGNELQTISKSGTTVSLSNGGGSFTDAVDDADNDATNELQNLASSQPTQITRTISISGGASTTISVSDSDDDTSNEIQTLSLNGATNDLQLTSGGTVNLSSYLDNTDSQDLANVLGQGADAGNVRITNLANPTNAQDAVNLQYLEAKDATDYAFKSAINDVGTGAALTFDLSTFDFDEGNLISTTQVSITEAGVYLFTIKGTSTNNALLVVNVNNATDYPVGLINLGTYYDTILLKLSAGDIIELRANTTSGGETITLEFFGYKI